MSYSKWATSLTNYFFGKHNAGKRIRLMLDEEILDEDFADLGGNDGFLKAVRTGPEWMASKDDDLGEICRYLQHQWKYKGARPDSYPELLRDAPPYLPYLCLFSYAWTIEWSGDQKDFGYLLETVPEPSTYALLLGGTVLGYAFWRRRK